jgi:hypothetical protein
MEIAQLHRRGASSAVVATPWSCGAVDARALGRQVAQLTMDELRQFEDALLLVWTWISPMS